MHRSTFTYMKVENRNKLLLCLKCPVYNCMSVYNIFSEAISEALSWLSIQSMKHCPCFPVTSRGNKLLKYNVLESIIQFNSISFYSADISRTQQTFLD